jgi:adenylosuccinate synthase
LPAAAQSYVLELEKISGARISSIGVGPDREATIIRHDLLG